PYYDLIHSLLFSIPAAYLFCFFFLTATATTEIYTLSLHDALPIFFRRPPARRAGSGGHLAQRGLRGRPRHQRPDLRRPRPRSGRDRKSTRLNSSHLVISYAVFCLKKKKK